MANGDVTSKFVLHCLRSNQLGDGLLYAALHQGRFVRNQSSGEWLVWRGHHWERDIMGEALAAVEDVALRYAEELGWIEDQIAEAGMDGRKDELARLEALKKNIERRVDRLRGIAGRQACLDFAASAPNGDSLAIHGRELDADPWLLAFENGVMDLRTGLFRQGRTDDYCLKSSQVEWAGFDAQCPNWDRAILEIMDDDPEMVRFLYRQIGCALIGQVMESKLFMWVGAGRNGKSFLMDVLTEIFGDLAAPIPAELFLDQGRARSSAGPSPDLMTLKGLRLAFASETDEGRKFSLAQVKNLTGRDKITARAPHEKHNSVWSPTHTLFLLTNHKPHAQAHDFAFWERVVLTEFPLAFVDRDPATDSERRADPFLMDKVRPELPAVAARFVEGCLEYMRDGLQTPAKSIAATAAFQKDEDVLADFIEDCCVLGPDFVADASAVYKKFTEWHQENVGKFVMSQRRFGKLFAKKFERFKQGVYKYRGVGLQYDFD